MDPALRAAASGMQAQQSRIEVISNNLANVNTTGFKRSRAHFEDLLYQTEQGATVIEGQAAETTEAIQIGRGTRLSAVQRVETQGTLEPTGREHDVAVEGAGYFQLETGDGTTSYTRDGSFTVTRDGTLVSTHGYTVSPGINLPVDAQRITISRDGVVSSETYDGAPPQEIGRIEMVRFNNPAGLRSLGQNLLAETAASGEPIQGFADEDGFGHLIQGSLEGSNVEIVQEMVDMITAMRAYEINSKAVKSAEEMSQIANNLIQ